MARRFFNTTARAIAGAVLVVMPSVAAAQGSIAGTVVEVSGGILPGVTVQATGTALDQPRSTVTDRSGRYELVDLPRGAYEVSFMLPGFQRVTRLVVVGLDARLPVDVVLRVGELAETITLSDPGSGIATAERGPTVLCGMTILPANPAIDPGIHEPPPDRRTRYTIVPVPPPMCR